jgi:CubicO group peptidase (beta-lactamase class C family)
MDATVNELPRTTELLQQQMTAGLHIGAQVYASLRGRVVADFAIGESRPGVEMTPDTIMLWMSATKPVAAVAIAQLWEAAKLSLDDPIARHIPEFAQNGKEAITIRNILTHTAPIRWIETGWPDTPWDQIIAKICVMRMERDWPPGKKAGYSVYATWFLLGEIVRRLDGRDYARYVREEIFAPLGMNNSWVATTPEAYRSYGTRLGIMQKTEGGTVSDLGMDTEAACTNARPSGSGHGPMRELGRFYEMLLAGGTLQERRIISPQTVEALVARHRAGMYDQTFKHIMDWGLGFVVNSNQYGPNTVPYGYGPYASARTYGHSGYQSSVAFGDPDKGLAAAIVCNGTAGEVQHNLRIRAVLTALYEDLGLATSDAPVSQSIRNQE